MIRILPPFALALALVACQPATAPTPAPSSSPSLAPSASPSPSASPAETADTEGCEHLANGPASAVTATPEDARPPMLDNDHKRYDITLAPGAATVHFQSDEAADYVLFLNQDIPVKVKELATGKDVAIETSAKSSTVCDTVKGRHGVELGVGVYAITFGPTPETRIGLVIEEGAGHGDDESNHQ